MKHAGPDGEDGLIETIYEAALDVGRWPEVLDRVRIRLGASNALILTPKLPPAEGLWVGYAYPEQAAEHYAGYFHQKDVWYRAADRLGWLRNKSVFHSDELIPAARFARTEFYNDHCRQFEIFHGCWTATPDSAPAQIPLTAFGFYRTERAEPFTAEDVAPLRRLGPHLQRAMEIHWRVRSGIQERRTGLALLETLPTAVLLLSETGHIVRMNRRSEALLSAPDGLIVRHRRLEASDSLSGRTLARLIGECVATGIHEGGAEGGRLFSAGGGLRVPRPSGKSAWRVLVAPLPIEPGRSGWDGLSWMGGRHSLAGRIAAAVFIGDPEAEAMVPERLLQAWFGLTPTEARVALDAANGYSPHEIAQRTGLAWHTVRTHLRALYEKMGVKRQTGLARKVLLCPGMTLAAKAKGTEDGQDGPHPAPAAPPSPGVAGISRRRSLRRGEGE